MEHDASLHKIRSNLSHHEYRNPQTVSRINLKLMTSSSARVTRKLDTITSHEVTHSLARHSTQTKSLQRISGQRKLQLAEMENDF